MSTFIGIDPGVTGALAVIYDHIGSALVFDVPVVMVISGTNKKRRRAQYDLPAMLGMLRDQLPHEPVAVLEATTPNPRHSAIGNHSLGRGQALWEMALIACAIPFELAPAARWKTAIGLPRGADKNASRLMAGRMFPDMAEELKRVKDHGRAEALLLAEHRRRIG